MPVFLSPYHLFDIDNLGLPDTKLVSCCDNAIWTWVSGKIESIQTFSSWPWSIEFWFTRSAQRASSFLASEAFAFFWSSQDLAYSSNFCSAARARSSTSLNLLLCSWSWRKKQLKKLLTISPEWKQLIIYAVSFLKGARMHIVYLSNNTRLLSNQLNTVVFVNRKC